MSQPTAEFNTLQDGRFLLQGEIGRGGMGVVWKALDTRLDRVVAIKGLSIQATEDVVTRLRREAKSVANLHNEHIAQVFDMFVENGLPFIVMQFVDGESLDAIVRRGERMPIDQLGRLLIDISRALMIAHRQDILHRDIKPANILRRPDGSFVLIDFGIAIVAQDTRITSQADVIGTFAFMAPERLQPEIRISGASDIWSLGATAYAITEGSSPIAADHPAAIIVKAMSNTPIAAPAHAGYLTPLISRMIAREPHHRPDPGQTMTMVQQLSESASRPTTQATVHPAVNQQINTSSLPPLPPRPTPTAVDPAPTAVGHQQVAKPGFFALLRWARPILLAEIVWAATAITLVITLALGHRLTITAPAVIDLGVGTLALAAAWALKVMVRRNWPRPPTGRAANTVQVLLYLALAVAAGRFVLLIATRQW